MSASINKKCTSNTSPEVTVTLSDVKLQRNRERVAVRGFAVPISLKNLKADLLKSTATKSSSTSSSDTNTDSDSIPAIKKRDTPGALPENTQTPPWRAPPRTAVRSRSDRFSQKQPCTEQQEEEEEFHRNPNTPLHRPHKQLRSILPTPRNNSAVARDQQEQQQQHTTEDDSSYYSTRSMLPPLWTERFAKSVTNSVNNTVDGIISQGSLLHAPKRKFWSSLTPQDILRSSSHRNGNEEKESDVLGSGSFSKVTKVHIRGKKKDNKNLLFALKRLKGDLLPLKLTEHSCKNGAVDAFTKAATELAREAFLLSRFDHPHIINIMGWTDGGVTSYSAYRRHDAYFLVLELLQEETLDDRIEGWNQDDAHVKAMSYTQDKRKVHFHKRKIEQLTICKQVANALAYIHSKNVVYRDLKPQNIGFAREVDNHSHTSKGNVVVKLMDFGLARELPSGGILLHPPSAFPEYESNFRSHTTQKESASLFDMTGTVGTIRYMAPEVCLNRPYGLECDIYSWSIVAHEILSQSKPYDDMTPDMYQSMVCQHGVRPPPQNMPSEYNVLLTQAWRTDPSKRMPLHRIQRQLDLLLQQEKLMWEAQELLSGMPEKSESPIFLSQSYTDEKVGTRHGSHQGRGGGRVNKRSWYRANNVTSIPNETPRKNPIFPNASMEYHGEHPALIDYNHHHNYHHTSTTTRSNFVYEQQSPQPHRHVGTTSLSPSSRLPEPVTPELQQQQQLLHERTIHNDCSNDYNCDYNYDDYNQNYSDYHYNHHYNSHSGAGTLNGHLSPSNDQGHWNGAYY
jgi:serine/threonine protein kinase